MPDRPDLDTLERDAFDVVKIRVALPFLLAEARAAETLREALREFQREAILSLVRPGRLAGWKARFADLGARDE